VVAHDPGRAGRRNAVARCVLPRLRDEPGDWSAHHGPSPAGIGRDARAWAAVLVVSGIGTDAEAARAVRSAAGDRREGPFLATLALQRQKPSCQEEWSRPRGGIGVEAGTLLFGEEQAPHINFCLHCHRVAMRKLCLNCASPSLIAVSCTIPQKATMTLRIGWFSGWGLWGEVGGTDLAAPAFRFAPSAGADVFVGAESARGDDLPVSGPHGAPFTREKEAV
jgi:hypothetical protein